MKVGADLTKVVVILDSRDGHTKRDLESKVGSYNGRSYEGGIVKDTFLEYHMEKGTTWWTLNGVIEYVN